MSKRRKHKRTRAKGKVTLQQQLASLPIPARTYGPHGGAGAVHVCGTRASTAKGDGLTPMQRDLIREASSLQSVKAQGEITLGYMMVQEPHGWNVHTYNPNMPARETLTGKIAAIDGATMTDAYGDTLAIRKEHDATTTAATIQRLRSLRNMKSLTSNIEVNQDIWGD